MWVVTVHEATLASFSIQLEEDNWRTLYYTVTVSCFCVEYEGLSVWSMEQLLSENLQDLQEIFGIIKLLPQIGYDVTLREFAPDELKRLYG